MIPLVGFLPDSDPVTPGVITDCTNLVPYQAGMEGGPGTATPTDVPALAAECRGAAVVYKLDGSRRFVAGTQTKLYEISAGAWDDISQAGNYDIGSEGVWCFAQFGDATMAASKAETIQRSTSGDFADIAGAPKAKIVFPVGSQVMALNVDDGSDKPDGWHCCAVFDETDWTEAYATQSASGRLVSVAGPIMAGGAIGPHAYAYKQRAIFRGTYVYPDTAIWQWERVIGGDAGCVGQDAWCDIGDRHFIVGETDFWLFDGNTPVPVGEGIRQWFFNRVSQTGISKTRCVFDRQQNRVWVFYCSNGASSLDSALVWHVATRKWGRADRSIEAAVNYIATGTQINGVSGTFDALPNIPFDSQYWLAGGRAFSIFDTSHQLQALTGSSSSSAYTTGDVGDDRGFSLLQEIHLRFAREPTSATATVYSKMTSGADWAAGPTASMQDGKFDFLIEARWFKARIDFAGPVQITKMGEQHKPAGKR